MSSTHLNSNAADPSAASAHHAAHASAAIQSAGAEAATIYVSPLGAGDQTGSSAGNAAPFAQLNTAIQTAGPAGTVMLLADQGNYDTTVPVALSSGGQDGAPVTIQGVDSLGNAMDAIFYGTRAPIYTPGTLAKGNSVFDLGSGADNLVFDGMDFNNVGIAFHLVADAHNITIQNIEADNVRLFAGNYLGDTYASASVTGLTLRDVEVHGFSYGVITLKYDSSNVVIDNVYGDSEYQDKDGIAIGVHLDGTVHDVLIENSTMLNCIKTGTYYNGDGFATERGVYNVRFEDTVARGNADGGYDLKSTGTVLVNALAEDNGRNFRLWGHVDLIDPVGIDPHQRGGTSGQYQIQLMDGAQITVTGGWFVDSGSKTSVVHRDSNTSIAFSGSHVVYAGSLITGLGLDPAFVAPTVATGIYSTDAEMYVGGQIVPPLPPPVLTGTIGNDVLQATTDANWTVSGLGGNDSITTNGGNDLVTGGTGNDVMSSGAGDDVLQIKGIGQGFDIVDGGLGTDQIQALATGTVIGLASITGIELITANGFGSVAIVGSGSADVLDFTSVTLTGIASISGGAGNDTISGSAQADMISGGNGADTLTGNGGSDVFDFNAISASTASAPDRIVDFASGVDKIDLAGIDASTKSGGNQAFSFIGGAGFSHSAGQLRVDTSDANKTVIFGDVNGDGVADFAIQLDGNHPLTASDFVL